MAFLSTCSDQCGNDSLYFLLILYMTSVSLVTPWHGRSKVCVFHQHLYTIISYSSLLHKITFVV